MAASARHSQRVRAKIRRARGLQFSSPTPTNYLRSIAIGSGVYVGEGTTNGSAATKVERELPAEMGGGGASAGTV